ncbi:hypothetical protein CYLTODRAFT_427495 [Cylindrobasidium torrendii FP15055 ss-10]|uniref:Uncharacterized protein n=1 Tax=Cylindrobasidium torrendii FP15055 ss-10 TaxID=1314674 RepID=A0A0D7AUK1_9AGAR|nr:hypothetical protein CYLTODRAFT_427495 [Cylindrobasidium torrendii FP15055 ss-10]
MKFSAILLAVSPVLALPLSRWDDELSVEISGSFSQCGRIQINIEGGSAPYTISISERRKLDLAPAVAVATDSNAMLISAIPFSAGVQVVMRVEDARGERMDSGLVTVAQSGDASCLPPMTDADGTLFQRLVSWIQAGLNSWNNGYMI